MNFLERIKNRINNAKKIVSKSGYTNYFFDEILIDEELKIAIIRYPAEFNKEDFAWISFREVKVPIEIDQVFDCYKLAFNKMDEIETIQNMEILKDL